MHVALDCRIAISIFEAILGAGAAIKAPETGAKDSKVGKICVSRESQNFLTFFRARLNCSVSSISLLLRQVERGGVCYYRTCNDGLKFQNSALTENFNFSI